MYGLMTRTVDDLEWEVFDRHCYEVKDVTGRSAQPAPGVVNTISCFADNAAVDAEPSLVAVDEAGRPATRERPYFDWSTVCPSSDRYREGVLDIVDDCVAVAPDVRLDDVGFPRDGYCHCDRCKADFEESHYDEYGEWRASVITDFIAEVANRIPGKTIVTLYPDPYPDHLFHRSGIDLEAIEPLVDEFVVPLYDTAYGTTYWLETIARGFDTLLDTPFAVEVYAVNVDLDALVHATEVAAGTADSVIFGYDASAGQAAIRRIRADERDGVTHGEPSTGDRGEEQQPDR